MAPTSLSTKVIALPDDDFATIVVDRPAIASALLLTPSWQALTSPQGTLPDAGAVSAALSRQLGGLATLPAGTELTILVGSGENLSPAATTVGDVAIVQLRRSPTIDVDEVARTLAPSVLRSRFQPAAPDRRCSEPLLALAEALANAGSLALASLPAELRPVHEWFEAKDAAPSVANLASLVLQREVPWRTREVRLARVGRIGGPSPELANSAAVLLEAFGDAPRARQRPFDLLLAWRQARRKDAFPPMPAALRKALDDPLAAGMPEDGDKDADEQRAAIAEAALRRILERGELPQESLSDATPLALRGLAAANARAKGQSDVCSWLGSDLPDGLRTGCREQGEGGGWVYARPGDDGHFEIVARAATGAEIVLLRWPRWVLFPAVNRASHDLLFVDREGAWTVPLEGGGSPHKLVSGAFRFLTVPPDAPGWAAVRWPEGSVLVETGSRHGELPVRARNGLAWLDQHILIVADDGAAMLVSSDGESRPIPGDLHCSRSLATSAGGVVCGFARPCDPGLVRFNLGDAKAQTVLTLQASPIGVQILSDGSLVFGASDGLYRWTGAAAAERVGAGLTPGPA